MRGSIPRQIPRIERKSARARPYERARARARTRTQKDQQKCKNKKDTRIQIRWTQQDSSNRYELRHVYAKRLHVAFRNIEFHRNNIPDEENDNFSRGLRHTGPSRMQKNIPQTVINRRELLRIMAGSGGIYRLPWVYKAASADTTRVCRKINCRGVSTHRAGVHQDELHHVYAQCTCAVHSRPFLYYPQSERSTNSQ